jgi:hypothetical protein
MGKKRRNAASRKRPTRSAGSFYRHPLADVDREELRSALVKLAAKQAEEFPTLLARFDVQLRSTYPPQIIGILSGWGLLGGVSSEGVTGKTMIPSVQQHHIELLQALSLRLPVEEWGKEPPAPADIQAAIDSITELADAYHQRRLTAAAVEGTETEVAARAIFEKIRLHTQAVRNWGHFSQMVAIVRELYEPLDEGLIRSVGFSFTDLALVGEALVSLLEDRLNCRFSALQKVFREKKPRRLLEKYFQYFPFLEGTAAEVLEALHEDIGYDGMRSFILGHADLALERIASFNAPEVAAKSGIPVERVFKALSRISLKPGELSAHQTEHIFMDNPVWIRPLVDMGDTFYASAPQVIFSFFDRIARDLADEANIRVNHDRRRASYLEMRVSRLLANAFPGSEVRENQKWSENGVQYETDVLVKLDTCVIIAECKAGFVTGPALRGATERVQRHISELLVAPAMQAERLERLIYEAREGNSAAHETLAPFGLDFSNVQHIARLAITLDDFTVLASSELDLKEAKLIPVDMSLSVTMNLADLEIVLDILQGPTLIFHYLYERRRFQGAVTFFADELDLLGFYLDTGFNIWATEQEKPQLIITGMSAEIDRYYMSRDAGIELPKPAPRLRPYFESLLATVESRRPSGWLSMSTDLLSALSYDEQRRVENGMERLRKEVPRRWRDPNHTCCVFVKPPPIRNCGVMFYVYPPQLRGQRHELAQALATQALQEMSTQRCLIVARNTASWCDPYGFFGTAFAPSETDD